MEGLFLIAWVVLCGIVSFIAVQRRRGGVVWFVASLVLSPLVGYATLVAIPMGEPQ